MLVAWAVITASTSRWRWLILAHPIITVFVVVATGNHYWADAIVSIAIVASFSRCRPCCGPGWAGSGRSSAEHRDQGGSAG